MAVISTDAAKTHLNVGHSGDDAYIEDLVEVAAKKAEAWTRRKLLTTEVTGYLEAWPAGDAIVLPYGNLQSVTSVKYTDTAGDQSTFSSDNYIVETGSEPGRIVLGYGKNWPGGALYPSNPIEIVFTCGYGDEGTDVDSLIIHAIKIMIADLYEHREDVIVGAVSKNLQAARALCMLCRFWADSSVKVL